MLTHSEQGSQKTQLRNALQKNKCQVYIFFQLINLYFAWDSNKIIFIGVIEARDEFKDVDLVFPWNAPYLMKRKAHYSVRPFYVRHNDEEIRVTLNTLDTHVKREYVYFMHL